MRKLKTFLEGLVIETFFDTYQEWHAFCEGFAEGFCLLASKYQPNEELLKDLEGEHHYYAFGRVSGFAFISVLLTGMIVWIIGAARC